MPVTRHLLENYVAFIDDGDGDTCAHVTVRLHDPTGEPMGDWHWTAAMFNLLEWGSLNTVAEHAGGDFGFYSEVFLTDDADEGEDTKTTVKLLRTHSGSTHGHTVIFTGRAETRKLLIDQLGGRIHDPAEPPVASISLEIRLAHRPHNREALAKLHLIPGGEERGLLRDDSHLMDLARQIRSLQEQGDEAALTAFYESYDAGTIREAVSTLQGLQEG